MYCTYVCVHTYVCVMCMHTHIYTYMSHTFTPRLYIQYLYMHMYIHTYIHILTYIYTHIVYIVRVVFVCVYALHGKVWPESSLLSIKETPVVSVAHSSESPGGDQEVTTSRFLPIYDVNQRHVDQLSLQPISKKKTTLLDYYSIHYLSYFSVVV